MYWKLAMTQARKVRSSELSYTAALSYNLCVGCCCMHPVSLFSTASAWSVDQRMAGPLLSVLHQRSLSPPTGIRQRRRQL